VQAAMAASNTQITPSGMWVKTKAGDDGVGYSVYLRPPVDDDTTDKIIKAVSDIKPTKKIKPPKHADEDLLTAYLIADVHMGLLAWGKETGEDYNTETAAARVRDWVSQCVAASPPSKTAIILDVGDYHHADDTTNATPRGRHTLDVDTRFHRTMDISIQALGTAIEAALAKHENVIVRILPGNHNPHAYMVAMFAIAERYRNNPRVQVQTEPGEFFAYEFGSNLIAAHHGDKAKATQLVLWLADEHPQMWGRTEHRYLFTGHLHHHKSQEIGGVQWQQLRAVSARDAYAASGAYRSRAGMEAQVYHKIKGRIQRHEVNAA